MCLTRMSRQETGSKTFKVCRLAVDTARLERSSLKRRNCIRPEKSTSFNMTMDSDDMSVSRTKFYVDHAYHDHSYERHSEKTSDSFSEDHDVDEDDEASHSSSGKRKGPRGGVTVPFPEKLHKMLSNIEKDGYSHIISWQPHGRCFVVHKPKEFVAKIMPLYFKQTKLTSFQRQLNLYGFCRLTTGTDRGGYYHELFLRGRPSLCKRMIRTRIKGTGSKGVNNPSSEPNFYEMPFVSATRGTPLDPPRLTKSLKEEGCEGEVESLFEEVEDAFFPPPLSKPVLPESITSMPVVTPPQTPLQQVMPPPPELQLDWLLEDEMEDEMKITFEGKTFHFLDTSSFEYLGEDRGYDQAWVGTKENFLAGFDML